MGYYITIKNELLEQKHVVAMGSSVWLYMWLIDKVMAINENGIGKVFNGRPVLYEEIQADLGISRRTYLRWIEQLEYANYIRTVRAPYGLVFTINKAQKMWGKKSQSNNGELFPDARYAKNGASKEKKKTPKKAERCAKNGMRDVPQTVHLHTKNGASNNNNSNYSSTNNNSTNVELAQVPEKVDFVTKLYYEVIKSLGLPTLNHDNVRKKIAAMKTEASEDELVIYLEFMRDKYPSMRHALDGLDYRPDITEALDIYAKRLKVVEAFRRLSREQQPRVWRPTIA